MNFFFNAIVHTCIVFLFDVHMSPTYVSVSFYIRNALQINVALRNIGCMIRPKDSNMGPT